MMTGRLRDFQYISRGNETRLQSRCCPAVDRRQSRFAAAAIMALVGHDSVAKSQHYTQVAREALENAANALPDVAGIEPSLGKL